MNTPLTTAYIMKESLRQIWNKNTLREVTVSISGWLRSAYATGISHVVRLSKSIERHGEGILNYYKCRISCSPIE
jgi:transposase